MQFELPEQFISDKERFNGQGIVRSADLVESEQKIINELGDMNQLIDQLIDQSAVSQLYDLSVTQSLDQSFNYSITH